MFGNHGLCGLPEEGAHEKSPKCLGGNLGDFGEFCKGLGLLSLLDRVSTTGVSESKPPLSEIDDKRLLQILHGRDAVKGGIADFDTKAARLFPCKQKRRKRAMPAF